MSLGVELAGARKSVTPATRDSMGRIQWNADHVMQGLGQLARWGTVTQARSARQYRVNAWDKSPNHQKIEIPLRATRYLLKAKR